MRPVKKFGESLRIIWAIAAKDIADGLKNRSTLTIVILLFFILGLYKLIPTLWEAGRTDIVVYDAGDSRLVTELENSSEFRLRQTSSFEEFEERVNQVIYTTATPAEYELSHATQVVDQRILPKRHEYGVVMRKP